MRPQPEVTDVQTRLLTLSPFLLDLPNVESVGKVVIFLEGNNLSAEDSLEKIKTFAEKEHEDKEVIFVEHVHGNHWQIQKKESKSWDLKKIDVWGDGRCGIVSTMIALRELGKINDVEFDKYIEKKKDGSHILKQEFDNRGTPEKRTELAEFLCKNIVDVGQKQQEETKITELLERTDRDRWLYSDTIKKILQSQSSSDQDISIFAPEPNQLELNQLFTTPKDAKFEVATILLGLLNEKFNGRIESAKFVHDLSNLFGGEDPNLKVKLGFSAERKVDFSDIFPIGETEEKARTFYSENAGKINNFLTRFDELKFSEANLMDSPVTENPRKSFINFGLLIHQIDHIQKTQSGYIGEINIEQAKTNWDILADQTLKSGSADDQLKKDIVAIRNRWKVGQEEIIALVATVKRAESATKMRTEAVDQPIEVGDIFSDLTKNFDKLKESGTAPDKAIFLSTCTFVNSQASNLSDENFLKSFANFFFDNLEHFDAVGDRQTAESAFSASRKINAELRRLNLGSIEDYLDDSDERKQHYRLQRDQFLQGKPYYVLVKKEPIVKKELQQFALDICDQGEDYEAKLSDKLHTHFEKEGSFLGKIKTLPSVFEDKAVFQSYAQFFSNLDSPLIPESFKPEPQCPYEGWGKKIEITEFKDGRFTLKLEGREIESIMHGDVNKLEEFKAISDEKLRIFEITNFFRTTKSDILIRFTNNTEGFLEKKDKKLFQIDENGTAQPFTANSFDEKGATPQSEEKALQKIKVDNLRRNLLYFAEEVSKPAFQADKVPSAQTQRRGEDNFLSQAFENLRKTFLRDGAHKE